MTTIERSGQQRAIDRIGWPVWFLATAAIIVLMVLVLSVMGRAPFYAGGVKFWYGLRSGPEQSQHFADWYTFTHILHGPAFFLLLWLVFRKGLRWALPAGLLFVLAIAIEAAWEVFENTEFIINRYRTKTIARGYAGDTILNSVGDTLAMAVGYLFIMRFRIGTVIAGFFLLDLVLLIGLRGNLTLNVVMLLFGGLDLELIQSIKRWQQSALLTPLGHMAVVGLALGLLAADVTLHKGEDGVGGLDRSRGGKPRLSGRSMGRPLFGKRATGMRDTVASIALNVFMRQYSRRIWACSWEGRLCPILGEPRRRT